MFDEALPAVSLQQVRSLMDAGGLARADRRVQLMVGVAPAVQQRLTRSHTEAGQLAVDLTELATVSPAPVFEPLVTYLSNAASMMPPGDADALLAALPEPVRPLVEARVIRREETPERCVSGAGLQPMEWAVLIAMLIALGLIVWSAT